MSTLFNEKIGYTIWRSGSDYYAQDGHTNTIDYKGTDAATVINAAIDALGSGTILIKAGTYPITAPLDIAYNQNVHLIGEGMRATILDSSATGAVTTLLTIGGATDVIYGALVSDIGFKGVTGTTTLIKLYNSRSSCIQRCHFNQFQYGIHVAPLGAPEQNYGHIIQGCYMNGPNGTTSLAGIYLQGEDATWKVTTTQIINCYIHDVATCIKMYFCSQVNVYGCALEWANIGIEIAYSSNNNKFFAVNIESITTMDVRIQNAGVDCAYNIFYSCDLWGANKVSNAGWQNKFILCREFITENRGTATIISGTTSIVVNHGLSITPVAGEITVTPMELSTADPGEIYVDTITSTQFTIKCRTNPGASNLDIGWCARTCYSST